MKKELAEIVENWQALGEQIKDEHRYDKWIYLFGSNLIEGAPLANRLSFARQWYQEDVDKVEGNTPAHKRVREDRKNARKHLTADPSYVPKQWCYLTLRYIQENFKLSTFEYVIEKVQSFILKGQPVVDRIHYVHECNTENGISYHTHMLIETKFSPSKVRECCEKAFMGKRDPIISMKNMIDAKNHKSNDKAIPYDAAKNYIMGNKCKEKMRYVELDKIWRAENNILVKTDFSIF